ncbi:hypothetical protein IRJ41_005975 [Triplophysa rosa]|uniref:Uncharacterized protein n=1 Tax=Triplophysa rosa TaxID=992332 RepID=A0A9W7WNG7_TRIRA|nr:hypothetical protein IRJ41_005975 [Triplophysa rosa]
MALLRSGRPHDTRCTGAKAFSQTFLKTFHTTRCRLQHGSQQASSALR